MAAVRMMLATTKNHADMTSMLFGHIFCLPTIIIVIVIIVLLLHKGAVVTAVATEQEGSEMEVDPQATAALLASTPLASGPVIWPKPPTWAPPTSSKSPPGSLPAP